MRIVFHIDMDAFFAAVEVREKPWLKGKPVVVGADPKSGKGRGVVSTASYKAREYGIHSAMPISQAWRLAEKAIGEGKPKTIFLAGDFEKYSAASQRIMAILKKYAGQFEQASIDEAYLEPKIENSPKQSKFATGRAKSENRNSNWKFAEKVAKEIKKEIFRKEKLTCSIGIGSNKLIAKIASNVQKPGGLTVIRPEDIQKFLDPKPVEIIPGIGPKAKVILNHRKIRTINDLRRMRRDELVEIFGRRGGDMYEKALGINESPVSDGGEAKSIGEQMTFEKNTLDSGILIKALLDLARSVFRNVKKQKLIFKTVSIIVRFADFETKSRTHTARMPIRDYKTFEREALKLFLSFLDRRENPEEKLVRLIGVRAEHLGNLLLPGSRKNKFVAKQGRLF